jgi:hypothetical protein
MYRCGCCGCLCIQVGLLTALGGRDTTCLSRGEGAVQGILLAGPDSERAFLSNCYFTKAGDNGLEHNEAFD